MSSPETTLRRRLRGDLRHIGVAVTQVIEAGVPGAADFILEWPGHFIWLELKVDAKLRPEQRIFLRKRWDLMRNAFVLREHRLKSGILYKLYTGDGALLKGAEVWTSPTLDAARLVAAIESCRARQALVDSAGLAPP